MGGIGGIFGLGGGSSGSGYTVQPGTDQGQMETAYSNTQNSLVQQQNLLKALQAQKGLQNESNVYNQLQNVVAGQGPNAAQAMLNQSTGQNVANQAALMAGQRGSSANPALLARQAAQQGANLQQQAAGQGASMQAQQSLNALGQAGNMAGTQAANQIGQTNAINAANLGEQNALLGNNAQTNAVEGQLVNTSLQGQQAIVGNLLNGGAAASAMGGLAGFLAEGGNVQENSAFTPQSMFAQSLMAAPQVNVPQYSSDNPGAKALAGEKPKKDKQGTDPDTQRFNSMVVEKDPFEGVDTPTFTGNAAGGGKVPAMVSPGEKFLKPHEAKAVAKGKVDPMKVGEKIPGKASVKGDSYKNDVVPRKLDVGGVVIPKSVMESKNPGLEAKKFVDACLAKKRMKK